jgi:hypothetical protein
VIADTSLVFLRYLPGSGVSEKYPTYFPRAHAPLNETAEYWAYPSDWPGCFWHDAAPNSHPQSIGGHENPLFLFYICFLFFHVGFLQKTLICSSPTLSTRFFVDNRTVGAKRTGAEGLCDAPFDDLSTVRAVH